MPRLIANDSKIFNGKKRDTQPASIFYEKMFSKLSERDARIRSFCKEYVKYLLNISYLRLDKYRLDSDHLLESLAKAETEMKTAFQRIYEIDTTMQVDSIVNMMYDYCCIYDYQHWDEHEKRSIQKIIRLLMKNLYKCN